MCRLQHRTQQQARGPRFLPDLSPLCSFWIATRPSSSMANESPSMPEECAGTGPINDFAFVEDGSIIAATRGEALSK